MKFEWKDEPEFDGRFGGTGTYEDLWADGQRRTGYFVCVSETPPWASYPGDWECQEFADVATAKAWVEAQYILREDL